ncbi:MAG: MnhB domain-containing protein [Rhodospirillales bacterium]
MTSGILRTTARLLKPLLLIFSIIVLLRGHNAPGGGFVGGLLAAAAFALQAISTDVAAARRGLRVSPHVLMGAGLALATLSGTVGLLAGRPFLTEESVAIAFPWGGELRLGTALAFDASVYLVVLGAVALIILTLAEE